MTTPNSYTYETLSCLEKAFFLFSTCSTEQNPLLGEEREKNRNPICNMESSYSEQIIPLQRSNRLNSYFHSMQLLKAHFFYDRQLQRTSKECLQS